MDRYMGLDAHASSCTLAGWLYEVLEPHVHELVVVGVTESRGQKNDRLDAFGLAEQLRIGAIGTKVYKKRGQFGRLGHLGSAYGCLVADTARVKNRIKSLFRSRGVSCGAGREVYGKRGREVWVERLPEAVRPRVELKQLPPDQKSQVNQPAFLMYSSTATTVQAGIRSLFRTAPDARARK